MVENAQPVFCGGKSQGVVEGGCEVQDDQGGSENADADDAPGVRAIGGKDDHEG